MIVTDFFNKIFIKRLYAFTPKICYNKKMAIPYAYEHKSTWYLYLLVLVTIIDLM